jgi:hypoxanthine phosphoribosyltransferase
MNKRYIAANDLLLDSFQLAANIIDSGFRPDFLVGLWRGGSAVGIAVQEGLDFLGCKTDHIAIRTSYRGQEGYTEMIDKAGSIRVHGLRYLHERVCAENSMLIVDDVYRSSSPYPKSRDATCPTTFVSPRSGTGLPRKLFAPRSFMCTRRPTG